MSEIETIENPEVLGALEFHARFANEHYRNAGSFARRTLEEAIACGKHLAAARAEFSERQVRDGEWGRWLDENFEGSRATARNFIRLYNKRESLGVDSDYQPGSITAALKALSSSQEEEPEKPEEAEEPEQPEPEPEQEPAQVPEADPSEAIASERQRRIEAEEKAKAEAEARKKIQQQKQDAHKRAKELKAKVDALTEEHEKRMAELSATMRENVKKQLADVYARYGIQESPSIFEADEEAFQAALEKTRSRREEEALKTLSDALKVGARMRAYEPEEAARAFLRWPSPESAAEEIKDQLSWLARCDEEIDALTTKGHLRAVKGGE